MRRGNRFLGPFLADRALAFALVSIVLLAPHAARADELKLKDGTEIAGTIVGFEDNSFKVKTSYGYALVQKDQVVSIGMADAAKAPPEKKPEPAAKRLPAPEKQLAEPASASAPTATATANKTAVPREPVPVPATAKNSGASASSIATPKIAPTRAPASPSPAPAAPPAIGLAPPKLPAPVANAEPPKPPAPEPIREKVSGNTYTNETYRFRMYKPPAWEVIGSAPTVLPGAITAMGTNDQTTYLLIGQEPAGKSPAAQMDATERRLRDVMDHFRPLGEQRIMVSGAPAVEHRFRGMVDQHDWSGVVVLVPRGARLYTIFGMTRADNDLVQIQENVIARAISSLQFTEQ